VERVCVGELHAAFFTESRMRLIDSNKLYRKSGSLMKAAHVDVGGAPCWKSGEMGGNGRACEHSSSLCRSYAGRYASAMPRSNRVAEAISFTKPDLHLLLLCIAASVFFAVGAGRAFRASNDLVPVYTGARCLLHGCNPYDTKQLEQQFFQGGGRPTELPSWEIDVPVYPPSTFLVLSPLALLRFPTARLLWFLLNGSLFVTAAGLIVSLCPGRQRWLTTALGSFILATSGILLVLGQPAAFAISLVIIGCFLFFRSCFLPLAAFLFTLSLAVKPQIGGLIVLYLLVQRIHWRYAAAALIGALSVLLCAGLILKLHSGRADWTSTLRANLSATLSPGGSADPRPANVQAVGDPNLQPLTSIFFTDAWTFNVVAYAIFVILLLALILVVLRANADPELHLRALAAVSVLSLTPVYHRFYDARLLLLTIPAVLIVYQRRRLLGSMIAILTILAVISVQYRVQVFLLQHTLWQSVVENKLLLILLLRQQNLELLILFFLYLFAIRSMRFSSAPEIDSCPAYEPAMPL
jgi:Glycosyltransferase family 87